MHDFSAPREMPTMLLIDDDLVSREVMATVLTMSGYAVHTAVDGDASLELLATGTCVPDVVLMDAQMPGLSGAELIAQLRTLTRAGIFAISASQPPSEVTAAADGFLLKPFSPDDLHKLLQAHAPQPAPISALDPDEPVVDPKILAQLREMMPEAKVREIYAAILADLATRQLALELAIAKDDDAEVRRIGHAIKGGCGMAGAAQIARIGALLEALKLEAGGDDLDNSARLLRDLRTASTNLQRMLEAGFTA
jgi:CheY-like chemotaxis protein/HPt (histidine-containing phosphotransfer) domain-containing protein